jgi:hypothetical protein
MTTAMQRALLSLASSMPDIDEARARQLAKLERWGKRRMELILDGESRLNAERQAEIEVFGSITASA